MQRRMPDAPVRRRCQDFAAVEFAMKLSSKNYLRIDSDIKVLGGQHFQSFPTRLYIQNGAR